MKNLAQYINEHYDLIEEYCKIIDEINTEIIVESFNCSIFRELIDQQNKLREKYEDQKAAYLYSYPNEPLNVTILFKNRRIAWDKITDSNIKTYKGNDSEGISVYKKICSNRSNSLNGIVVFEETETKEYKYNSIIIKLGFDINFYNLNTGKRDSLKPKETLSLIDEQTTYHIIVLDDELYSKLDTNKLRLQRNNSQYGLIRPGNKEDYERLARDNRERYRKLAEKMKMDKLAAKDEIPGKVIEYVNKVMDLSLAFSKEPAKYSKFSYEISKIIDLVSDKEVGHYERGKYHKYGINGLMYYYTLYLKAKLSLASGESYSGTRKEFETYKAKILDMFSKIDETIEKINEKISKSEQSN